MTQNLDSFQDTFSGNSRPSETDLLHALLVYRTEPGNALLENALAQNIDQAIRFMARRCLVKVKAGKNKGQSGRSDRLESQFDELVDATWARLLSQKEKSGQLLAGYDATLENGKRSSVYNWILSNFNYTALDVLRKLKNSLEDFTLDEPDAEEEDEQSQREEPSISETPLRASHLRVTTVTPWLVSLAREMVGQKIILEEDGKKPKTVVLDHTHQNIWLKWLALKPQEAALSDKTANYSASELSGLTEQKLADTLGISKRVVQDYSDEAYAFMLAHKDFPRYMELMIPNALRGTVASDEVLSQTMLEALHAPGGKVGFRACVHVWLERHYG